jgi:hypothetical protein
MKLEKNGVFVKGLRVKKPLKKGWFFDTRGWLKIVVRE